MDLNRWKNFTKQQQLLAVGSEFMRAKNWQKKDRGKFLSALERSFELIDLTLADEKWRDNLLMLLELRNEVAKFYTLKRTDDISFLYNAL